MEKNIHLPPRGTEPGPKALTDKGASVAQNPEQMSRDNFIKRIIRLGLLVLLAVISVVLSGRITFDKCSGCPGKGRCNGETDCNKY
jgi:hypothetical protein